MSQAPSHVQRDALFSFQPFRVSSQSVTTRSKVPSDPARCASRQRLCVVKLLREPQQIYKQDLKQTEKESTVPFNVFLQLGKETFGFKPQNHGVAQTHSQQLPLCVNIAKSQLI